MHLVDPHRDHDYYFELPREEERDRPVPTSPLKTLDPVAHPPFPWYSLNRLL
jgi:hypothetical protein